MNDPAPDADEPDRTPEPSASRDDDAFVTPGYELQRRASLAKDRRDFQALDSAVGSARRAEGLQLLALGRLMERTCGPPAGPPSRDLEFAFRSLRLEVSARYKLSEYAAARLLNIAHQAGTLFRSAVNVLLAGEINSTNLRVVVEEGAPFGLEPSGPLAIKRSRYETAVLDHARIEPSNRLRPIARRLALEFSELNEDARNEEAAARRSVCVSDLPDGMAELRAYLPAAVAYGIRDRIRQIAKSVVLLEAKSGPAVPEKAQDPRPRKRPQVEADVMADLLLRGVTDAGATPDPADGDEPIGGSPGSAAGELRPALGIGVSAHIQVIIPAHTLGERGEARRTDGIPELVGYGPIGSTAARELAGGERVWDAVSVDPDGAVLSVDRYRPSAEIRRLLAARDLHCRAPGCRIRASKCDLDHTKAAVIGGETRTDNLAHLCRGHHTLKHNSPWKVEQQPGGVLKWVSPTGTEHIERPPSRVRFRTARDEEPDAF